MSGGQPGAQAGGNMYGSMQPPPKNTMQTAFDPNMGAAGGNMGNPASRYGAQTPPTSALLTGDYGQSGGNMLPGMGGTAGEVDPSMGGGAMSGGNMYDSMGGAMGKLGGATTNPVNPMGQGGYQQPGAFGPRWATWSGPLPGPGKPYEWGGPPQSPLPPPGGTAPPPRGSPPPGDPRRPVAAPIETKAAGGVDHMANLRALMGEDPRLANEYRLRNGDTIGWWQGNQGNVAQQLFNGNEGAMQEWLRGTSPVSSNASPLTQAEMMRLNQMAGIRGPSWMR